MKIKKEGAGRGKSIDEGGKKVPQSHEHRNTPHLRKGAGSLGKYGKGSTSSPAKRGCLIKCAS